MFNGVLWRQKCVCVCVCVQHKVYLREQHCHCGILSHHHSLQSYFGIGKIHLGPKPRVFIYWNMPKVSFYIKASSCCWLKGSIALELQWEASALSNSKLTARVRVRALPASRSCGLRQGGLSTLHCPRPALLQGPQRSSLSEHCLNECNITLSSWSQQILKLKLYLKR